MAGILSSLTFGTDYNQVSTWDASSASWKHWVNDSDFNDFTSFEYGKTYEIYNPSGVDKSFSVTGKSRGADLTHNLVSGDNFISPVVKAATNVTTVLSSLIQNTDWSDVKRFNAAAQTWESYAGGAFTQFEPGKGYNIIGLRSASFSSGKNETATTFVYDSTGARVKKTAGSTTTVYLGKDYEVEGSGSTKYIFLGDRRIATKQSTGSFFFFHSDHISSSNVITDASGNQAALYEYDPYGSTVTHTGTTDVKHQFTGQEKDDSTGLLYYNARYYDPQLGRFVTADWIVPDAANPQEFNRYSYVNNNPIKFTDPTGHKKRGFWSRFFTKLFAFTIAAIVAAVVFVATRDPYLTAGTFGAVYRGAEAKMNGASWSETLNAAARGYYEGISAANGGPEAKINLIISDPETGSISRDDFKESTRQNQSALSQAVGLTLLAAAVVTSQIEGTTAKNSGSPEISRAAIITNEIHISDQAMTRLTDRIGVGAPSGNILSSPASPGGGIIPPATDGVFVPGAGYALAVKMAMGVGPTVANVIARGKADIKQVNAAARKAGIKDRRGFGDFIESFKESLGMRNDHNLGWHKLLDLAEEFKRSGGK